MRQRTELKQRQKQTFNARFSTSVRLLKMSNSELSEEVRDVLDSNPLLEEVESGASSSESLFSFPTMTPSVADADYGYSLDVAARQSAAPTVRDHLHEQIRQSGFQGARRMIAEAIADSLDERGYLVESTREIYEMLPVDTGIEMVEEMLAVVQQFEPLGIAARSLKECLLIQLDSIDDSSTMVANACKIVERYLEAVGNYRFDIIVEELGMTLEEVNEAIELIQTLNPTPGSIFAEPAKAVIPDVIARKVENQWVVGLNSDVLPRLGISSMYQSMIAANHESGADYLKRNLSSANTFLHSLNRRYVTVLSVARELVERQQEFLEHGESAMQPLTLLEVADSLNLHESTVSRACAGKYIMTPRGTFELKTFFSYRIKNLAGSDESATSIQHLLQRLIEREDSRNPLTDQQITDQLRGSGIQIARRTVAKYRSALNIPPRSTRKARRVNLMAIWR